MILLARMFGKKLSFPRCRLQCKYTVALADNRLIANVRLSPILANIASRMTPVRFDQVPNQDH